MCFVPLASIRTPELVASSIAQRLGLRGTGDRPLAESVARVRDRRLPILLDNFEHLLAAAPAVVDILKATRSVHVMVTSRSPLRVSGEQEYVVPP